MQDVELQLAQGPKYDVWLREVAKAEKAEGSEATSTHASIGAILCLTL
jgi:hypothetical protein